MKKKHTVRYQIRPLTILGYLMVVLCLFLLFYFFRSSFYLFSLLLLFMLPVLSVLYLRYTVSTVSIRAVAWETDISIRDLGHFELIADNQGYGLSFYCKCIGTLGNAFYQTMDDFEAVLPVSMRASESLELPVLSEYSGRIELCISHYKIRDLLGIVDACVQCDTETQLMIFPKERKINDRSIQAYEEGMSETEESIAKGNDYAEVTDMREYRPGDRMKDIHWKLSAKKQTLMVKERTSVAQSQMILLVDLSQNRDITEEVLAFTYGLTKELLEASIPVNLLWWEKDKNDFSNVSLQKGQLRDGFLSLYQSSCGQSSPIRLSDLLMRMRPELPSFVLISGQQGEVTGEVIARD